MFVSRCGSPMGWRRCTGWVWTRSSRSARIRCCSRWARPASRRASARGCRRCAASTVITGRSSPAPARCTRARCSPRLGGVAGPPGPPRRAADLPVPASAPLDRADRAGRPRAAAPPAGTRCSDRAPRCPCSARRSSKRGSTPALRHGWPTTASPAPWSSPAAPISRWCSRPPRAPAGASSSRSRSASRSCSPTTARPTCRPS